MGLVSAHNTINTYHVLHDSECPCGIVRPTGSHLWTEVIEVIVAHFLERGTELSVTVPERFEKPYCVLTAIISRLCMFLIAKKLGGPYP